MNIARMSIARMSIKRCVQMIIGMIAATITTATGAVTRRNATGTLTPTPQHAATTVFSQLRKIGIAPAPSMAASTSGCRYN